LLSRESLFQFSRTRNIKDIAYWSSPNSLNVSLIYSAANLSGCCLQLDPQISSLILVLNRLYSATALLESKVFIPLAVRVSNCTFFTAFAKLFIFLPFRLVGVSNPHYPIIQLLSAVTSLSSTGWAEPVIYCSAGPRPQYIGSSPTSLSRFYVQYLEFLPQPKERILRTLSTWLTFVTPCSTRV